MRKLQENSDNSRVVRQNNEQRIFCQVISLLVISHLYKMRLDLEQETLDTSLTEWSQTPSSTPSFYPLPLMTTSLILYLFQIYPSFIDDTLRLALLSREGTTTCTIVTSL